LPTKGNRRALEWNERRMQGQKRLDFLERLLEGCYF
jgi:hypothetical protein